MNHLLEQSPYSNIDYLYFGGKKHIYVMLNHRVAYLSWMDALKNGFMKPYALLFHIDWHDDYTVGSSNLLERHNAITSDKEQQLIDFVRAEFRGDNSDFIVPAMHRGFIGDTISIDKLDHYADDGKLFGTFKKMTYETTNRTEFKDAEGRLHTFYLGGRSIKELTGYRGLLTDHMTHQDLQAAYSEAINQHNVLLDIDLDYFTYEDCGQSWALNDRNLTDFLYSDGFGILLHSANVITIALEPSCCGGTDECLTILNRLSKRIKGEFAVDIEQSTIAKFTKELEQL
jgi:hypothetical protein